MAPEQAEGGRRDPRVRRLLARAHPLRGLDRRQPVRAAGSRPPPRRLGTPLPPLAARRAATCPSSLCDAIDDALARGPGAERAEPRRSCGPALAEAERELDEQGGLMEPATLLRVGLPARRRRRRFGRRRDPVLDTRDAVALAALAEDLRGTRPPGWAARAAVAARSASPRRSPAGWRRELPAGAGCRRVGGRGPGQRGRRCSPISADLRRGGGGGHRPAAARGVVRVRPRRSAGGWPPRRTGPAPPCSILAAADRSAPVPAAGRTALVGARARAAPGNDRPRPRPSSGLAALAPTPGAAPGSPPRARSG